MSAFGGSGGELVISHADRPTLELAIAAWLDAKTKRTGSKRTHEAYASAIDSFRDMLAKMRLDLDGDTRAVGLVAQGWAGKERPDGTPVTAATFNQRMAILSSFYTFARRRGLLVVENPIAPIERRPVQPYAGSRALDFEETRRRVEEINRASLIGARDYALLGIALQTSRRLSELADLRWGDVEVSQKSTKVTLTFRHAKGGKVLRDALARLLSEALLMYLHRLYGANLMQLAADAPVWVSFSGRTPTGKPLGVRDIERLCQRRLGITKAHILRHTAAHGMEHVGMKLTDIQRRLGHSNAATTSRYLSALASAENPHAEALAALFGYADAEEPNKKGKR